jgi:hypothetical protein
VILVWKIPLLLVDQNDPLAQNKIAVAVLLRQDDFKQNQFSPTFSLYKIRYPTRKCVVTPYSINRQIKTNAFVSSTTHPANFGTQIFIQNLKRNKTINRNHLL